MAGMATHVSFHRDVFGRYSWRYFALLIGLAAVSAANVVIQFPSFYRRARRVRHGIIVTLGAVLVSAVAAEIAVRVLDPFGISYVEAASKAWSEHVSDPRLVYRLPSNWHGRQKGVGVSTNALGLRDRTLEPKERDELRLLFVGDSITFGWGVPVEETFVSRLESILARRLGHKTRTVNAGVAGYNTVQEHALLKSHFAVIQPDLVTLLYVYNDIEQNASFDSVSQATVVGDTPPRLLRALLEKSWLYRVGRFVFVDSQSNLPSSLDSGARGVKDSMDALANIAKVCREHGIRFVTFFYRDRQSGSDMPFMDELLSEVSKVGKSYGFPVVDTRSWWGNIDRQLLTNSTIDWHPNSRAHSILAEGMADVLVANDDTEYVARTDSDGRQSPSPQAVADVIGPLVPSSTR
jgi:lysophospholipase L1-like esterase